MPEAGQRRIAVVGGGMAGLEVAVAAARAGAAVEVFEVGPRTRTRHVDWDTERHPGDEKVRSWTSDGWGAGGGLSHRLGGRSLCYHGVLLGLEPAALATWGPPWSDRLGGQGGLYASILDGLRADFPELAPSPWHARLADVGLRHVPQAARLDGSGRFETYSPLARTLELITGGRIRVTRGRVHAVAWRRGGWFVEVGRSGGTEGHGGFHSCVLASSAIGNVEILAASLKRDIVTSVTDHFCVGGFVRLPPGPALTPFRHAMLWSGFVEVPQSGMNVFAIERPALPGGDRIVQLQAVIEQRGGVGSHSELTVGERNGGLHSHIRARVSPADRAHLDVARAEIRRWAQRLAGDAVHVVPGGSAGPSAGRRRRADRDDTRWFGHDDALEAVAATDVVPGVFSEYEVPYGTFEHEACTHPVGDGPVPVSSDLEVLELPGVYVAGPGAFPRLGAANPALTIISLSRWLGERCAVG